MRLSMFSEINAKIKIRPLINLLDIHFSNAAYVSHCLHVIVRSYFTWLNLSKDMNKPTTP